MKLLDPENKLNVNGLGPNPVASVLTSVLNPAPRVGEPQPLPMASTSNNVAFTNTVSAFTNSIGAPMSNVNAPTNIVSTSYSNFGTLDSSLPSVTESRACNAFNNG